MNHKIPRLRHLMMFAACLAPTEADACIRDYRANVPYSSEAVNHYGGPREVVRRAVALRTNYALREYIRPFRP